MIYCAGNSTSRSHRRWWHVSCATLKEQKTPEQQKLKTLAPDQQWLCPDCSSSRDGMGAAGMDDGEENIGTADRAINNQTAIPSSPTGEKEVKNEPDTQRDITVWRQMLHVMARRCMGNASRIIGGVRAKLDIDPSVKSSLLSMMWRQTMLDRHFCFAFLSVRRLLAYVADQACQFRVRTRLPAA